MKVIREFKCLRSGRIYVVGSDYPENDVKRVNDLAKKGFLERGIPVPERSKENAGGSKTVHRSQKLDP